VVQKSTLLGLIKQNPTNTAIREDFELQADFSADLGDDESDSDFDSDGEDGIDFANSIPEGMDKDSPDLQHAIDLAGHLSCPRTTDSNNDPPIAQSITELANCQDSPLHITPQQSTLEQILDKLGAMDLGIYCVISHSL
jgi:hypothetical protein